MIGSEKTWMIVILIACVAAIIYGLRIERINRKKGIDLISKASFILPVLFILVMAFLLKAKESPSEHATVEDETEEVEYQPEELEKIEIIPMGTDFAGEDDGETIFLDAGLYANIGLTVEASSRLSGKYEASNVIDKDLKTCWQEGIPNDVGIGEYLDFSWDRPKDIKYIAIRNGSWVSEKKYYQNARPSLIKVTGMNDSLELDLPLEDEYGAWQIFELHGFSDTQNLKFTIADVYPGTVYTDTVISDINFYE